MGAVELESESKVCAEVDDEAVCTLPLCWLACMVVVEDADSDLSSVVCGDCAEGCRLTTAVAIVACWIVLCNLARSSRAKIATTTLHYDCRALMYRSRTVRKDSVSSCFAFVYDAMRASDVD